MGLDMFLTGKKFYWTKYDENRNLIPPEQEDGYDLKEKRFELGYWRKHPNLHGYIVNSFADGDDNCNEIWLSGDDLRQIIAAIKNNQLPETNGFFFGTSDGSETERDLNIFSKALGWLDTDENGVSRDIYYRASW